MRIYDNIIIRRNALKNFLSREFRYSRASSILRRLPDGRWIKHAPNVLLVLCNNIIYCATYRANFCLHAIIEIPTFSAFTSETFGLQDWPYDAVRSTAPSLVITSRSLTSPSHIACTYLRNFCRARRLTSESQLHACFFASLPRNL